MENARHEAAVSLLTGHERFVRLVLQRTITPEQGYYMIIVCSRFALTETFRRIMLIIEINN